MSSDGITAENCFSKVFNGMIRERLSFNWKSLPLRTKRIIQDLEEFGKILWGLVTLNSIDFTTSWK